MKSIGYAVSIVGILVLILGFDPVRKALKITLPSGFNVLYITIVGIIIVVIGAFLVIKSDPSRGGEVPIYHGNKIVGYRRV